jgi:hypothetical protein
MYSKRDRTLDRVMVLDALRGVAAVGGPSVTAADLARATRGLGHHVPKKFVRRRLTENGDGVTAIENVQILEQLRSRFRYRYCTPLASASA